MILIFEIWNVYNKYFLNSHSHKKFFIMDELEEEERMVIQANMRITMKMIECGDLIHYKTPKYGIILVGPSIAGKTTVAHQIVGSSVSAEKTETGVLRFVLQNTFNEYLGVRIGPGNQSETQIPN